MNNDSIKQGFVKRAQEHGVTSQQAIWLFKQANPELQDLPMASGLAGGMLGGTAAMGPGAVIGGGLGAISGLMDGTEDEKGETHRFRNALRNGGIGAGLGAAGGYAAGGLGLGIPAYQNGAELRDQMNSSGSYNSLKDHLKGVFGK